MKVIARCATCSWATPGKEAAALHVTLDGKYSQHILAVNPNEGDGTSEFVLGPVAAGDHDVAIVADRPDPAAAITIVDVAIVAAGAPEYAAVAHSPLLHARPGTLARFSDLPFVMWYAIEPSPRGRWIKYSVIFSDEDGGTPVDKRMARWGRITDIEYVYGVELDANGRVLDEQFQGPEHRYQRFGGVRIAGHPVTYIVTENNMVGDRGTTAETFALKPTPFEIRHESREVVMDAHPWLYRISSEEAIRERHVSATAAPGSGLVPDPRRFVYIEACAQLDNAAIGFDAGFGSGDSMTWSSADGDHADFRIDWEGGSRAPMERPDGCFRGAVAAPAGAGPLRALRWRAHSKPRRSGEPEPSGSKNATITRINKVFQLGDGYLPNPNLFTSERTIALTVDGPGVQVAIQGSGR